MTTSPSEILSTTEAAARCGVSPETIRRWIRTKGLPAYNTTLGMNIRIRLSDLEEFARRHNILLREAGPELRAPNRARREAERAAASSEVAPQPETASPAPEMLDAA